MSLIRNYWLHTFLVGLAASVIFLVNFGSETSAKVDTHALIELAPVEDEEPESFNELNQRMNQLQEKAIDLAFNKNDRPGSNTYFHQSAEAARALIKQYSEKIEGRVKVIVAQALYNDACTYAIEEKPEEAIAALKLALEQGFDDPIIKTDEELDSLRDRDDFKALMAAGEEEGPLDPDFDSFPFSFELTDLDDKTVTLNDYKGKVVVVDIWGTWCPPCRVEVPELVKLQKKYGDDGLQVIGVNYEGTQDRAEAVAKIKAFAEEYDINYPCVIGTEEVQEQIPGFRGYPTTIFIDRKGSVRAMEVGFAPSMAPKLESTVKTLLDEKVAAE